MGNGKGNLKRGLIRLGLWLVIFLFAFGLVGGAVMFIAATGKFPPRPDRQTDELIAANKISAPTAVLVMRYQNEIYKKSWPDGTSVDRQFSLGDLMEAWIAEAVMMLSDRGKVDLDAPLADYFPGESGLDPAKSIASYLDHSASVGHEGVNPAVVRDTSHYKWLLRLIQKVTGTTPQGFLHSEVHEVLEMNSTEYRVSGGKGTWVSTIEDLATWTKTLNSNKLIHLKTYLRGHTPISLENGEKAPYGFGWRFEPWNGMRLEQANSFGEDANFSITRLPQRNFFVIICSEMPPEDLDVAELGKQVARFYLEREFAAPFRRGGKGKAD